MRKLVSCWQLWSCPMKNRLSTDTTPTMSRLVSRIATAMMSRLVPTHSAADDVSASVADSERQLTSD